MDLLEIALTGVAICVILLILAALYAALSKPKDTKGRHGKHDD